MELYAWGANSHGQLGVGRQSEFELFMKVTDIPKNILQIVGAGGHALLLLDDDSLWASGWNNKGQLGIGSTTDSCKFTNVHHKFQRVSAGWNSSAGITWDGHLFVWGSNHQDQLGFSKKQHDNLLVPTELQLPLDESAEVIQFGLRHTVILTKSNQIFIVGCLKHFQSVDHRVLNHNSTEYLHIVPKKRVCQITSGQNHVLLLYEDNSICGIGDKRFMLCKEIKEPEKIIQISSGWTHNAFLTETKSLYVYGRNNYGQCGNGLRSEFETPQKCFIHPIDDFELGAEHAILLSKGKVFAFGWNEHGNCGDGTFNDLLKPERIHLPTNGQVLKVFAGSGFCMVLCKSRKTSISC